MDNLKRSGDSDTEFNDTKIVKRQRLEETINLGDKREQVINIIKREFENEITKRQEEVHLIQERLLKAQKTLHLLKYVIIKSFYDKKELKIVSTTNEESILKQSGTDQEYKNNSAQSRIHPALKKLLGKKPLTSVSCDFGRTRGQQQNTITNLISSETVEEVREVTKTTENEQNTAETTQSTEISKEIKVPIRNKQKIKYDVIIGNISKYIPSTNSQDASTHKWMVYVRGPRDNPDISFFVKKVRFFLHPSYQPNDIVEIEESPFHLSRRGWGEFPLRIQIHFQNSQNKPIDVIHNLKLDQNKTGRQTLGNETALNVWLYDNSEETSAIEEEVKQIKQEQEDENNLEYDEDSNIVIKEEVNEESLTEEFIIKDEPQNTFEPQPCCSKYLDPPQDYEFDIEELSFENNCRVYLVDHCYAGLKLDDVIYTFDRDKYKIKIPLEKLVSTRQIVYFLFKSLPLVTNLAEDNYYLCCYPYAASTLEEFSSWNIGKRHCSEWYRAKQIKTLLRENKIPDEEEWTIKFILMFGRAHAFTPLSDYTIFQNKSESGKTIPNNLADSEYRSTFTEYIPISTLMENCSIKVQCKEDDQIIDVEGSEVVEEIIPKTLQVESTETDSHLLPLCNYVKKCASQIQIYLKDEEIEPEVFHNSSERAILQSVMCLAEELIRTAWANKVIERRGRNLNCCIEKRDIIQVLLQREEFDIFTNEGLGKSVT